MTTSSSLSSRRGVGGFSALVGGILTIVSVFLPWLGYPSAGSTVTGWDTYALTSGGARWFTLDAFSVGGFSPGFSGVSVLIAGGLMALLGLALLFTLTGGAFRLGTVAAVVLGVLALVAFLVGVTNPASLLATGDPNLVTPEYGLFVLAAGSVVGLVSVWAGVTGRRS